MTSFSSRMTAAVVMLLSLAAETARAAACDELAEPEERLACYDKLSACADTADAEARLACYESSLVQGQDAAAQGIVQREKVSGDALPAEHRAAEQPPADDSAGHEPGSDEPAARTRIVDVATDHRGRSRLVLENGEVWQTLGDTRFRFRKGLQVELREGIFGSTNLHAEGLDGYVKVRRRE